MDAIICVTVVLPLLPVTAINGKLNCARQPAASSPNAMRASGTTSAGKPCASAWASPEASQTTATAPCALAWAMNVLPSKRSPRKATNRSPACRLRLSVCTRSATTPCTCTPRAWLSQLRASVKLSFMDTGAFMRSPPGAAQRVAAKPCGPAPHPKTGGARP